MVDALILQAPFERKKLSLVLRREGDRVGVLWEVAGAALPGGVNELSSHHPEGEVLPDHDVVSQPGAGVELRMN